MTNNIFDIIGFSIADINLFPRTTIEEIIQNISILLTTMVGTVPLDRNLGLDATAIDEPLPRAMMKLTIFTLETIQEYEPRVEIQEVDFVPHPDNALDGKLYPKVVFRILDEYLVGGDNAR